MNKIKMVFVEVSFEIERTFNLKTRAQRIIDAVKNKFEFKDIITEDALIELQVCMPIMRCEIMEQKFTIMCLYCSASSQAISELAEILCAFSDSAKIVKTEMGTVFEADGKEIHNIFTLGLTEVADDVQDGSNVVKFSNNSGEKFTFSIFTRKEKDEYACFMVSHKMIDYFNNTETGPAISTHVDSLYKMIRAYFRNREIIITSEEEADNA